jgi:RNA polymerase sigma-70 factor (ECF subfamily)
MGAEMTGEVTLNLPLIAEATSTINQVRASQIYRETGHRMYALAFWMTNNELEAEELTENCFLRAFAALASPDENSIERAFISELRASQPIGVLTLDCGVNKKISSVRLRAKRAELEEAVRALPATERLIFLLHDADGSDAGRIAQLLGLEPTEVLSGLNQARLRIRELLAA